MIVSFFTLRKVAIVPHIVINGVRKRYMNPFAFLVVGAGLSLLTFNYFEEEFKAVNADINSEQIRQLKASANKDISKLKNLTESERQKLEIEKKGAQLQLNFMDGLMEFMLRYYNLLTFVFLFMQC